MDKFITKETIITVILVVFTIVQMNFFATKLDLANIQLDIANTKLELKEYSDKADNELLKNVESKLDKIDRKLDSFR